MKRVLSWDYKAQVPLDRLANAVFDASGGTVSITEVDTGGDEYAVIVASPPQTAEEAQASYETWVEGQ